MSAPLLGGRMNTELQDHCQSRVQTLQGHGIRGWAAFDRLNRWETDLATGKTHTGLPDKTQTEVEGPMQRSSPCTLRVHT